MARSDDPAVVLGASVDGLVAAASLAAAGRRVRLLEAGPTPGGLNATFEVHPGHVVPGLLHETGLVRRDHLAAHRLDGHGLRWREEESAILVEGSGGAGLLAHPDPARATGLGADREAYAEWRSSLAKLGPLVEEVLDEAPPEALDPGASELFRLAKKGLRLRSLGERDMMELLRVATMPARDWMEERFQDEALRAALVAPVLSGTIVGPRAAGTTMLLIARECARGPEPAGGMAALVAALAARCEELGVELRTGTSVAALEGDQDGVTGVRLADGETLATGLVLSALDPRGTLLDLVPPNLLPTDVETEIQGWRSRGSTAVHALALSAPPRFTCAPEGATPERVVTARTLETLERAADALKYGALPEAPWLDARVWSASDPDTAPAGAATLSLHVHGVPCTPEGGWTAELRNALRESVLGELERVAPGSRDLVVADELLVPSDLEERFGATGGHLYHGEQALDQLWLQRPSIALSRYATPIPGLYLAGAGSHPGGPFAGGAGSLGARAALRG
jgi:phytoene dehydrogenase-like protein